MPEEPAETWIDHWAPHKARYKVKTKLTWPDFIDGLPAELPDPLTLFCIGGLTLSGFTFNDIDFYMEEDWEDVALYSASLLEMTKELFDKSSHIGNEIYYSLTPTPIPIKIYDSGILNPRNALKAQVIVRENRIPSQRTVDNRLNARFAVIEAQLGITTPPHNDPPIPWKRRR